VESRVLISEVCPPDPKKTPSEQVEPALRLVTAGDDLPGMTDHILASRSSTASTTVAPPMVSTAIIM
jgi:hypothetical protein